MDELFPCITAAGGQQFRSVYLHLRDGFTHDRQLAINRPQSIKHKKLWQRYKEYVLFHDPNPLSWGIKEQRITVQVGQKVKRGQFLGYAGNNGAHG